MGTDEEPGVVGRRFDVADAAPVLLDAQGLVTGWTREAERLLGYPAPEVVGKQLADLLTGPDAERAPEVLERCRMDGGWAGLLTARCKGGPTPGAWCASPRPRSRAGRRAGWRCCRRCPAAPAGT